MALVNMKQSAEEAAEAMGMPEMTAPEYPYGLRLSLSEEDLAKLGLPLPRAGQGMKITAEAFVVSVNERVEEGEDEIECCVAVQITDMSMQPYTRQTLAKSLYPNLRSEAE